MLIKQAGWTISPVQSESGVRVKSGRKEWMKSLRVWFGDSSPDLNVLLGRLAGFRERVVARVKVLSLLENPRHHTAYTSQLPMPRCGKRCIRRGTSFGRRMESQMCGEEATNLHSVHGVLLGWELAVELEELLLLLRERLQ
jgi:hypothetical protein